MTIFKELLNAFGIADDILDVGYNDNGIDHDRILYRLYLQHGIIRSKRDVVLYNITTLKMAIVLLWDVKQNNTLCMANGMP